MQRERAVGVGNCYILFGRPLTSLLANNSILMPYCDNNVITEKIVYYWDLLLIIHGNCKKFNKYNAAPYSVAHIRGHIGAHRFQMSFN